MAIFGGRATLERSSLRARLVPHASRIQIDAFVVRAGVFDVVVIPVGEPSREVRLAELNAFGAAPQDLAAEAVLRTWEKELSQLDVRDHEISDGRTVRVLGIDDNAYVTLALLALDRFIDGRMDAGAFVTAPTFDSVAIYPVTTRRDSEVLAGLARVSANIAAQSAMECDPRVHWWDGQTFHEIEMLGVETREPVIGGPATLLSALEELP